MRKKKKPGNLNRGPWTSKDFGDALRSIGYKERTGGKHPQFEHPQRSGKVSLSHGWSGVIAGSRMFNSIADQSGLGKENLLRLMKGLPIED